MDTMLGWHFLQNTGRLGYRDGRKVVVGETFSVSGSPEIYKHGLHASERLISALQHAPGTILCRVELSGGLARGPDKAAATNRKVLAMADVKPQLIQFARECAERAKRHATAAGAAATAATAVTAATAHTAATAYAADVAATATAVTAAVAANVAYAAAYAAAAAAHAAADADAADAAAHAAAHAAATAERKWQEERLLELVVPVLGINKKKQGY